MGHAGEQPRRYTAEEYFALEEASDARHEFFEGEVFAMSGTTRAHNTIALNMAMALRQGIGDKECFVQIESVRLAVEENRLYTYPDVLVSCDPHDQRENQQVYSPILIVEVLSPSTAAYDRGLKFKQYQKLPSLHHYLMIAQNTWRVEWYCRNEANQWIITLLTDPEELLLIAELNLQMTVAQVYEKSGVAHFALNHPQILGCRMNKRWLLLAVSKPDTDEERGRNFKLYWQLPSLRHDIIMS